jgi:hypothetical protein
MDVTGLSICAVLRDWNKRDAANRADYPQSPVTIVDIPLWGSGDRLSYIHDRVRLHQEAQLEYDMEQSFTACSDDDRWKKEDSWAVKKKGLKRALRVFKDETEAKNFSDGQPVPTEIEHRAGEFTRCRGNYCGVADFCNQYQGDNNE